MELLHIFDEVSEYEGSDADIRHQKRIRLEPLIFDVLKRKYSGLLDTFWKSYTIPTSGDKAVVIIERRIHENLWFLIRNAAYFARGWKVIILCSTANIGYCNSILEGKSGVTLLPVFQGSPGRDQARSDYNSIMKSPDIYKYLNAEHLIFLQTDSYLRKPVPDSFLKYDYIAAPAEWNTDDMVGGTSFRRASAMIDICTRYTESIDSEDCFLSRGARSLGYKLPPFEEAVQYICESCIYEDAVGLHQWWTFFDPSGPDAIPILTGLLTFDAV